MKCFTNNRIIWFFIKCSLLIIESFKIFDIEGLEKLPFVFDEKMLNTNQLQQSFYLLRFFHQ